MIQYMYFCQTCWPKLADWQYRGLLDTVWKNIGLVDHYGNVTCQSMLNGTQCSNIIGRHLHRTGSGACGWIFFIWWLHASIIYSCRIMCEHCGRHILRTWADTKCCKLKERILNISSSEYFNGPYARQLVELKGFNCQLKREILNFMLSVEYLSKCTWIYWLHVLILLFLHFTYRYDDDYAGFDYQEEGARRKIPGPVGVRIGQEDQSNFCRILKNSYCTSVYRCTEDSA